ncbi:hypothetical protein EU528_12920 [Candidatus Thorarchaeota archaeon]|nr:MAG: hypothetical protein EU528_12920 [Candidatus Thorarchaeota archaeon]
MGELKIWIIAFLIVGFIIGLVTTVGWTANEIRVSTETLEYWQVFIGNAYWIFPIAMIGMLILAPIAKCLSD